MGRREDLNRELSLYLTEKVKHAPKQSKKVEEVPPDISADEVHIIPGEPSWLKRMLAKLKERKKPEEDEPQKIVEPPVETSPAEFEAEEKEFEEEKKQVGGFWDFIKGLFTQESPQEPATPPVEEKVQLHPDVKTLIESLIQTNVEVLSRLSQEELERYKRSEHYQKFKEDVERFKQLSNPPSQEHTQPSEK